MYKKRYAISKKLTSKLILFIALLFVVIMTIVIIEFTNTVKDFYSNEAFKEASLVADYIDGDKIKDYYVSHSNGGDAIVENSDGTITKNYETFETDEYYDEVKDFLQMSSEKMELEYLYIVAIEKDVHVYIWDSGEGDEVCELGDYEYYYGDGDEVMHRAYSSADSNEILITNSDTYGFLASAYVPILDSTGTPVALASVDISMNEIISDIYRMVVFFMIFIIIASVIFGVKFYLDIKKIVIEPITSLQEATANLIKADLKELTKSKVEMNTNNEFEDLADSYNYMITSLSQNIENLENVTAEKNRIGTELDVASKIQLSMLPTNFPTINDNEYVNVFATMDPAKEVGGDFYDFFFVDERHIAIVMADVSGKGVPAALFMAIGKTLIKDHTMLNENLSEVFHDVNNLLCASNSEGLFITAFEGVLDLVTGKMTYVNAGHEMPFIYRKDKGFECQRIRPGFVLAGMEDMNFKVGEFELQPGDKFFQYTDGVPEATNTNKELLGMDRLHDSLNKVKDKDPETILRSIKNDVDVFFKPADQFDDITMLCLEYTKKMEEK